MGHSLGDALGKFLDPPLALLFEPFSPPAPFPFSLLPPCNADVITRPPIVLGCKVMLRIGTKSERSQIRKTEDWIPEDMIEALYLP